MTNLNSVNFGLNTFCGPAILSALTGESTDRCAAVISRVSGKREIKAVDRNHLREALKLLRFEVEVTNYGGSTLYGTLYRMHNHNGLYVVCVPHHFVAIEIKGEEIYICDNHCKTPLDIKQSARLMQKVEAVWKVSRKSAPKFVKSEIYIERSVGSLKIYRYNYYENKEDNTQESLGYVHYQNGLELNAIIDEMGHQR